MSVIDVDRTQKRDRLTLATDDIIFVRYRAIEHRVYHHTVPLRLNCSRATGALVFCDIKLTLNDNVK